MTIPPPEPVAHRDAVGVLWAPIAGDAVVPDPRFRDQLAEALAGHLTDRDEMSGCAMRCGYDGDDRAEHLVDALLPLIAAEVATRVQAAANQRAAEALRAAAEEWESGMPDVYRPSPEGEWLRDRAATWIARGGPAE